jgi:hypothetical protein
VETSQNGSAFLVETVRVFPAASAVDSAILAIRVLPPNSAAGPDALVAAGLSQLAKLPLQHCPLADNCAKCVALRDPVGEEMIRLMYFGIAIFSIAPGTWRCADVSAAESELINPISFTFNFLQRLGLRFLCAGKIKSRFKY